MIKHKSQWFTQPKFLKINTLSIQEIEVDTQIYIIKYGIISGFWIGNCLSKRLSIAMETKQKTKWTNQTNQTKIVINAQFQFYILFNFDSYHPTRNILLLLHRIHNSRSFLFLMLLFRKMQGKWQTQMKKTETNCVKFRMDKSD